MSNKYRYLIGWLWQLRHQLQSAVYVLLGRAVMYKVRLEFDGKVTFPQPHPFVTGCAFNSVDDLGNAAIFNY